MQAWRIFNSSSNSSVKAQPAYAATASAVPNTTPPPLIPEVLSILHKRPDEYRMVTYECTKSLCLSCFFSLPADEANCLYEYIANNFVCPITGQVQGLVDGTLLLDVFVCGDRLHSQGRQHPKNFYTLKVFYSFFHFYQSAATYSTCW